MVGQYPGRKPTHSSAQVGEEQLEARGSGKIEGKWVRIEWGMKRTFDLPPSKQIKIGWLFYLHLSNGVCWFRFFGNGWGLHIKHLGKGQALFSDRNMFGPKLIVGWYRFRILRPSTFKSESHHYSSDLKEQLAQAIKNEDYERAAELRDKMEKL